MSDLNILHAQNADLRSRVSNSGLACDAPTSANRKDIDAFELAMRGGEKGFPQSGHTFDSLTSASERNAIAALDLAMRDGDKGIPLSGFGYDSPDATPFSKQLDPQPTNMLEQEKNSFSSLLQSTEHSSERNLAKNDSYRATGEEDKKLFEPFGRNDEQPLENGQSQLSSLFSMASSFNDVDAPARVDAPHVILSEEDLNLLVERILVSAAHDGTQEVRLILNESVLAGTEIILRRDLSGQLFVAMHCTDISTFQSLVASQFDLKQMLETKEVSEVHVSVDIHQDDNNPERRSQGYFDYEPDQLWKRDNA